MIENLSPEEKIELSKLYEDISVIAPYIGEDSRVELAQDLFLRGWHQ